MSKSTLKCKECNSMGESNCEICDSLYCFEHSIENLDECYICQADICLKCTGIYNFMEISPRNILFPEHEEISKNDKREACSTNWEMGSLVEGKEWRKAVHSGRVESYLS